MTDTKSQSWLHRDQKTFDAKRDANHLQRYPNAFKLDRSIQSSVYLTNCDEPEQDSFIYVKSSHNQPDAKDWSATADRHHVGVPISHSLELSKAIIRRGEMLIWDSRLVHMGGHARRKRPRGEYYELKMVRPASFKSDDTRGFLSALETDGIALITDIATFDQCDVIEAQFAEDVAKIWNFPKSNTWRELPDAAFGKHGRGGSAWGPICTTRAAWTARLLPNRIKVFEAIYPGEPLTCSIDSVHWSKRNGRLSVMAAFSPRKYRDDSALKRKCISQAYGLARTTHWAHLGQVTKFGYGNERNKLPQQRYDSVSTDYRGYGCKANVEIDKSIRQGAAKAVTYAIWKLADRLDVKTCVNMLDEKIAKWM